MGIAIGTIKELVRKLNGRNISGKAIIYGVQGVECQYDQLVELLQVENFPFKELDNNQIKLDDITQYGKTIHLDVLFWMLGFTQVESIDLFDYEKPTRILDLNKPIPENMIGQYDLVYDGGTSEHCFNVKEVMFNTVKLLKKGGIAIHHNPMAGYVNHGFYSFSPNMFYDFYSENGFDDIQVSINWLEKGKQYYYPYPYSEEIPNFVFSNSKSSAVFCCAIKSVNSDKQLTIPTQGSYMASILETSGKDAPVSILIKVKRIIKQYVPSFLIPRVPFVWRLIGNFALLKKKIVLSKKIKKKLKRSA